MATGLLPISRNFCLKLPERTHARSTSMAVTDPADVLRGKEKAKRMSSGEEKYSAFFETDLRILIDYMKRLQYLFVVFFTCFQAEPFF